MRFSQQVQRAGASLMMGGVFMGAFPGGAPPERPWYYRAPLWGVAVRQGSTQAMPLSGAVAANIVFLPPSAIPFGLTDEGERSAPTFADLDGDGDLDAFVGGYSGVTIYFENTGSATRPAMAPAEVDPFGLLDVGRHSAPSFADLDGDGDLDAFFGEYYGTTQYFENTGSASNPSFSPAIADPFGLEDVGYYSKPTFADLDGDGDPDAFLGEFSGATIFFENTGTAMNPAFSAPDTDPFGLSDVGELSAPTFADIDGDGDLDAFSGEKFGATYYFENTGNATGPAFAPVESNPFGLMSVGSELGYRSSPTFADLDGDGDLDAFIGEYQGAIRFFENIGTSSSPSFIKDVANQFSLTDVGYHSVPTLADLDGDGDLDAFIGEKYGTIQYFENTGTPNSPAFVAASANPFGLIDVGDFSAPSFADLDGDGDLDAFVGVRYGSTWYFENTGSVGSPAFSGAVGDPFGLTDVVSFSKPAFSDLDGDGDLDAFIGEGSGSTQYFENTGTKSNPAFAPAIADPFGLIDMGLRSSPAFADLDGDGDLDAFIGEKYGSVQYFENTGTATVPVFTSAVTDPFGLADVGFYSTPAFADVDGDGDLDAFIGEVYGKTFFFENVSDLVLPVEGTETVPSVVALEQNYPNPFKASTEIVYTLPQAGHVRLVIYDVQGREVARLVDGEKGAGEHRVPWVAEGLPSGLYVYRLEAGETAETRTMMLVR